MAYQNVGTPRFYVNLIEWGSLVGAYSPFSTLHLWRTLPVNPEGLGDESYLKSFDGIPFASNSFIALLGHNFKDNDSYYYLRQYGVPLPLTAVVNSEPTGVDDKHSAPYNGFSIATFNGNGINDILWEGSYGAMVGSIVLGTYFDVPHSPDLKLTMTRESGNATTLRSQKGSTFTNSFYHSAPLWGNVAPWELYSESTTNHAFARSGRRVWDLSFSYLSDSSVFPDTASLSRAGEPGYSLNYNDYLDNTLLYDDNFYSQVIHKTNGELPFIFQPDKNDNTQFAIARFDMSTFKFTQVANGVYNIKLKIRETW